MAFVVTLLSGFSTLFGIIPILFKYKNVDKIISYGLSFSGGVMLGISILDLVPSAFMILGNYYNYWVVFILLFVFLLMGIIISKILSSSFYNDNSLYNTGIMSMLGIIIHNIPEGIITFISTGNSLKMGINLAICIAFHNIPEGISISIPIYYSTNNKIKTFTYLLVAALSEPLGALISYLFLAKFINNIMIGVLYYLIGGLMIYISLFKIVPESLSYSNNNITKLFFFVGILFIIILLIIF